jgi:pyridoxal phosphate enzyme (YggS family)
MRENLEKVRRKISAAALQAGRDPAAIRMLMVSKTQPLVRIEEAYQEGQRLFAENRIQEWRAKAPQLPEDCEWHFIGRIQLNKVKYLDRSMALIHSLDRFELLRELERQGRQQDYTWTALIQVNIADDSAKAGLATQEVKDFLEILPDYPHVRVTGLMTIGRWGASEKDARQVFRELRLRREAWQKQAPPGIFLRELSMGMSADYEIAVKEGASIVRIGREIFEGLD